MSDNCGVIRSYLSFADDHSSANSSSSGIPRLTPESRLQTIIVSRALPRTFWRVPSRMLMKSTPLSAHSQVHIRAVVEGVIGKSGVTASDAAQIRNSRRPQRHFERGEIVAAVGAYRTARGSEEREAAVVFERLRPIGAFTPSDPTLQCIAEQEFAIGPSGRYP